MHTQDLNNKFDIIIPSYKIFDGSLGKGLIAYYGLDDNLASTYVTDNTKRGYGTASTNTSTLYSASGKIGGCFNFRGGANNDMVTLSGLEAVAGQYIDYGKPFSISMWINTTTWVNYALLFGHADATPWLKVRLLDTAGLPYYEVIVYLDVNNYIAVRNSTNITAAGWRFLTITYNGGVLSTSTLKTYLNAVNESTLRNLTGSNTSFKGNFYLAMSPTDTVKDYIGLMDQVCVWNRELTQAEITRLYNSGAGLQPLGNSYRVSQESAELITLSENRIPAAGIDWSGANWALSGSTWLHTAGATTDTVLSDDQFTDLSLCDKVRYLLTFTVSGMTAGTLTPYLEQGEKGIPISANGTYTQILNSGDSYFKLYFTPSSTFDGALASISLKALNDVVNMAHDGTIIDNGTDYSGIPYGNAKIIIYLGVLPTASAPGDPPSATLYFDSDDGVFKMWDYTAYAYIPIVFA